MSKIVFVLIDGLSRGVARDCMGYMEGLAEAGKAAAFDLRCELPALSRPLYHCLMAGVSPVESGVVCNDHNLGLARERSVFALASAQGRITAASAYHWMSELYNRFPYEPLRDRFTDDPSLPIRHGVFYDLDDYPDAAVMADGEILRRRRNPDFLLIHTMGVDDAGHRFGGDAAEYRRAAYAVDRLLAQYMPGWLADGCGVLVTSDHGMNPHRFHNGTTDAERDVPLYVAGPAFAPYPDARPKQTELCGTVCSALGLVHDKPYCRELLA